MMDYRSKPFYGDKRWCATCGVKRGYTEYRCHVCHCQTRGGNYRTGATAKVHISGLTGKEVSYA
jgi:hypothetical protein